MSICFWIVMAVVSIAAFLFVCVQVKTNNVLRNYFGSVVPDRTFLF